MHPHVYSHYKLAQGDSRYTYCIHSMYSGITVASCFKSNLILGL